jgi:CubicO group peptidase (beta-lactamase class C family)
MKCRSMLTIMMLLTTSLPVFAQYKPAAIPQTNQTALVLQHKAVVDSIILKYARENHMPGIAYGLVMNGELIYANYQGYTNLANKTSVDASSAFRIASMTKSFAAMGILILRDQGKLSLDDPASKYIPEMRQTKYLTTDAPVITIRDLMTHRAGFPEDNPYGDRQLADTDAELMQLMKENPSFSNAPGLQYEYSNLGFALLGSIIKNVSGQSYQQFIDQNIFKPLGMKNTYWEYTKVAPQQLAHGYRWIDGNWREEALLKDGSWGAMGGLITTVEDFSKYMKLHLQAWPIRDGREVGPLNRSSIREMHQLWNFNTINPRLNNKNCAAATGYGYGLGITRDCKGNIYVAHSGGLPGFGSSWMIKPNYNIGIVIMSNRTYSPVSRLSLPILDSLIALAGLQPYELSASAILEQRKSQLMAIMPEWKNSEQQNIFAENFFPDNPISMLRQQAKELFAKAGAIKEVKPMKPENNLRGSFDVIGENAILRIYFTLSPEHDPKIQEYRITEIKNQ